MIEGIFDRPEKPFSSLQNLLYLTKYILGCLLFLISLPIIPGMLFIDSIGYGYHSGAFHPWAFRALMWTFAIYALPCMLIMTGLAYLQGKGWILYPMLLCPLSAIQTQKQARRKGQKKQGWTVIKWKTPETK